MSFPARGTSASGTSPPCLCMQMRGGAGLTGSLLPHTSAAILWIKTSTVGVSCDGCSSSYPIEHEELQKLPQTT